MGMRSELEGKVLGRWERKNGEFLRRNLGISLQMLFQGLNEDGSIQFGKRKQFSGFTHYLSMISEEEQNELLKKHYKIITSSVQKNHFSSCPNITPLFTSFSLTITKLLASILTINLSLSPCPIKSLSLAFLSSSAEITLLLIWFSRSYKIMIPNPESKQNPLIHATIPQNLPYAASHCCKEHSTTPNSADNRSNYTHAAERSSHTSCSISHSQNHQENLANGASSLKQQLSCANQHQLLRTYNNISLLDLGQSTKLSLQLILAHRLTNLNPKHHPLFTTAIQAYQSFHLPQI